MLISKFLKMGLEGATPSNAKGSKRKNTYRLILTIDYKLYLEHIYLSWWARIGT